MENPTVWCTENSRPSVCHDVSNNKYTSLGLSATNGNQPSGLLCTSTEVNKQRIWTGEIPGDEALRRKAAFRSSPTQISQNTKEFISVSSSPQNSIGDCSLEGLSIHALSLKKSDSFSSNIYRTSERSSPESGCRIIRTPSRTFKVKSCSISDLQVAPSCPIETCNVINNTLSVSNEEVTCVEELHVKSSLLMLNDKNCESGGNQRDGFHKTPDEHHHHGFITRPFTFCKRKIHDIHDKRYSSRTCFLERQKSKSLSELCHIDKQQETSPPLRKATDIIPLPTFPHFTFHKDEKVKTKNFHSISFDAPGSTPLVVPQKKSGAPSIFLFQNTPESSPAESPVNNPERTMAETLGQFSFDENLSLGSGPKCIEDVLLLDKMEGEEEDPDNGKGEKKRRVSRVSFSCISNFKKRTAKRPGTLALEGLEREGDLEEGDSLPRRPSMLSFLSVGRPTRRPSMTSLLSVSPSVSLAGHRFSFSIGSRSDQMISLSFKSLETFVNEDNLVGLRGFLSSRSVVIDDRDDNGASILLHCAAKGKPDFCRELLAHGADVNAEDNDLWTPLISASKEGHKDVVSTLLEFDAAVDHRDLGSWTALMWACYKGHVQTAKTLLAYGADPNAQGQHHMTALVWAGGRGHTEIVKLLLEKGAKVNLGDKFGTSPLIWACRKGFIEIADDLLAHGANVDATGMYSWTPLIVATNGNYIELVNLLLEHKPNVNALDKDGGTALTIACKEGYCEISSALLRAGAYVNIQDRNSDSNLIYAARGGHKGVVEALLKKHVDIDCIGKEKKTALYWAVEKGHNQVVKLLLSANADIEHSTKDGDTALLRAVRTKNAEVVQMLVDRKARVIVADKKGDTALHIAMRGRSKRIVEILLRNPKNSQMLYRPNRAGETPYNIDLSHQKTILGQIFGARRLNTNEENENMLGYDLYSSSLADILSEPSLTMPISVGLYARWGSGKSFLIRKLKEEMNSFARQWVEPLFQFTPLVITLLIVTSVLLGFISMVSVSTSLWYVGLAVGGTFFLVTVVFLMAVWYGSRSKYDWHLWYKWSVALASQVAAFKLIAQVIFCSPPGSQWKEWKDGSPAKPLKFIFAEGAKPSSTGAGGNSVIQIMVSIFNMIENQYGLFPTRFYRAFRPKPFGSSSSWKYRRLCGIPYIAIFFITLGCGLTLTYLAVTYGFHGATPTKVENVVFVKNPLDKRAKDWDDVNPTVPEDGADAHQKVKRNIRFDDDDDDDDDDEYEEGEENQKKQDEFGRPLHGRLINPLLFMLSALVALVIVANIHTLARMVKALIFSHRRHLMTAISKFDTMNAEGYIPRLKEEVNLMVDMVRCLDAFTSQQTRLVVILDGLDTCEQEKVLAILDAVHTLFTDSNGPFIILMAIDPHIITKAIELNATKVFRESSFSGHDYLRNIVHLPFYLQNSGLRKVKLAEQAAAEHHRGRAHYVWNEQETEFVSLAMTSAMGGLHHMPVSRHMSSASELGYTMPQDRRMSSESGMSLVAARRTQSSRAGRRLRPSESVGSSIASNLHRVSAASDLNKVLLTDDYFNDINPRSMRRLMNVVYITGRLLKSFHIEFNWYHLALWTNITEQWPYRASWLIYTYERKEEVYEDKMSLKELFEKIKYQIPNSKETEPLLEMDRDERKFETFLSMHENVLHIFNMVIFLPFTINLDPYIKKKIKEEKLQVDEKYPRMNSPVVAPWQFGNQRFDNNNSRTSTLSWNAKTPPMNPKDFPGTLPHTMNPLMWGYHQPPTFPTAPPSGTLPFNTHPPINQPTISLPPEAQDKKLSTLSIDEVFELLEKVEGVSVNMLSSYKERFLENNINGKVLLHCNLDDLKQTLKMTFGDWELFKMLVVGLRDHELNLDDFTHRNYRLASTSQSDAYSQQHQPESLSDASDVSALADGSSMKRGSLRSSLSNKDRDDRKNTKMSMHSKQVTMEEQMIFGALQTLNEEAYEDVLEEQARQDARRIRFYDEVNEEDDGKKSFQSDPLSAREPAKEIDVVYLQSSPLMHHSVVSTPLEMDSAAPSLCSSFSPYRGSISLSRASSIKGGGSANVSPKHSTIKQPNPDNIDATPKQDSSPTHEPRMPSERDRPNSLDFQHVKVDGDRYVINSLPDHINNDGEIPQDYFMNPDSDATSPIIESTPLQNIQNGPKSLTLMEHLSAGSTCSLDKFRRLTRKLQRTLATQESTGSAENLNELESSPLVCNSNSLGVNSQGAPITAEATVDFDKGDPHSEPPSTTTANSNFFHLNNFDKETHV